MPLNTVSRKGRFKFEVQHFRTGDSCTMAKEYGHLNLQERAMLEMCLSNGKRPEGIAGYLGCARSSISRELNGA